MNILREPATDVDIRDFEKPVRQHQPLRRVLATIRAERDDLDAREALAEMERRHEDATAAGVGAVIDGVPVPAALVPAAALMRRRGIRRGGLDAALRYIGTNQTAHGCPQLILESDVDAVEATLPVSPGWASGAYDHPYNWGVDA